MEKKFYKEIGVDLKLIQQKYENVCKKLNATDIYHHNWDNEFFDVYFNDSQLRNYKSARTKIPLFQLLKYLEWCYCDRFDIKCEGVTWCLIRTKSEEDKDANNLQKEIS